MMRSQRILAAISATCVYAAAAAQTVEWIRSYNGPYNEEDVARAIAVDAAGNVYVTGNSEAAFLNNDYVTVKYDPNGNPSAAWPDLGDGVGVRRYDFVGNDDYANAIAVDELGNVYVTGQFINQGGGPNYDWGTLAYDGSGNLLWFATYGGSVGAWEEANHIALDGLGHVYVSGYTALSPNTGQDYCTIKYDAAAGQPSASWPDVGFGVGVRVYDNGQGSAERVHGMVVDDSGNVYVTGQSVPADYATIKYDAAGTEVWVARYDSGSWDVALAIALDEAGAVFITGGTRAGSAGYLTLKYDPDGELSADWPDVGFGLGVRVYNGPGGGGGARAIALDGSGCLYVTGQNEGVGTGRDYATIKYDPDGSPSSSWPDVGFGVGVRRYSTAGDFDDRADHIAVDAAGNAYVGGTVHSASNRDDWAIIKYSPTGEELWVETYNAPGNSHDYLSGFVLDDARNIYATGWGYTGAKTGTDYITIKYSQDVPGDLNCDGAFNGGDIDPFFLALGDPAAYAIAFPNCDIMNGDMNRDGRLDGGDIDPFFACLGGGNCP